MGVVYVFSCELHERGPAVAWRGVGEIFALVGVSGIRVTQLRVRRTTRTVLRTVNQVLKVVVPPKMRAMVVEGRMKGSESEYGGIGC